MGAPTMQETTETTAASTPAAPRTDRLELVKELSRGSIGIVHKARNPQLGRVIALRQFEVPQWLDDVNDLLKKILAEAKAASVLDHPNVARFYTCGYKGFTIFMTAEFIEGQTLKELMAARSPELPEILALAKQLGEALDYAHGKGVFHQFLNASNVKVLPDGTVKVLDFGLLKDKHLLSQTPAKKLENEPYLSPEEVKNKRPDRAANLFSAATILYELYTARNPFAGMHLGEVDRAIVDVNPHPLNMCHPRVPPAVSAVILKALSKTPSDRYPTGKQLVAALEEAMKAPFAAAAKPAAAPTAKPVTPKAPEPATPAGAVLDTDPANGSGPATGRVVPIAPTPARVQVRSMSQWKLVGAVAGCLLVVALLAFLFQRRPAEIPENAEAPPVASNKPVSAPAPAPVPAAAAAVSEPEAVASEPLEPITTTSVPGITRRGKNTRGSRVAAPAPAPSTPAEGQITVSSVPPDATIEIEGIAGQGWRTPQTIGSLAPGSYKLTVSKPGYAPDVRTVQVAAGNRMAVDVRLTVVKGFLNVAGSPPGAGVVIDGKDTGKVTPATFVLDPAVHNVVLRKAGYLESGSDIQLAAGQTMGYSPSLMVAGRTDNIKIAGGGVGKIFGGGSSQGKARIEIKTDPKGAQVIINGTPLQKTTPVEILVEAGNYDITLEKDGFKPVHENAIVGVEDRVKIDKTLTR
jgi:eukaryotic-like serine/threonine-protein kinase